MPRKADPLTGTPNQCSQVPGHLLSLEKRSDGAVLVRVRSEGPDGHRLPDAVFAFRCGDPQYSYWASRLQASTGQKD